MSTQTETAVSSATLAKLGSPLGVCVFPQPLQNRAQPANYAGYIHEVFKHAGVCYATVAPTDLRTTLPQLKLLVTVGDEPIDDETKSALRDWVKAGGAWLNLSGLCGLNDVLGVEYAPAGYVNPTWGAGPCLHGEGYLKAKHPTHVTLAHLKIPLHFFGGLAVRSVGAEVIAASTDKHQHAAGHDVMFENRFGAGRAITLSVDVTGTIVRIQQGIAVTRDGIPAHDGTGPVADAVLKSGDGGQLDWIFDRQPVSGVQGLNLFLEPVADLWREVILRSVFHLATAQNVALPVLWLYPRALPAIAHMSHDSDGNDVDRANELLGVLKQGEINSTWCVILPGYDQSIINQIRNAGHELATHYDAMTGTDGFTWGKQQWDDQHAGLQKQFGEVPVTNKNHYLRWEGDCEFYDWIAAKGIQLDQTKGPSKTGEAGFNFGSCHPYMPVTFDNRVIDVLELPTLTQDLVIFAPAKIAEPLIESTKRVHGILHLLFHPAHVGKPGVNDAILNSIRLAKDAGMEWWTSAAINSWERSRRAVSWSNYTTSGSGASVTLDGANELKDATILWLGSGSTQIDGQSTASTTFKAWGFDFHAATKSLVAGAHTISTKS